MLLAAAEPLGDSVLLWHAARSLGLPADAAGQAEAAGLVEFGARIRFRHPLVRSTVYRAAEPDERRRAHRALAQASDPERDPDRHAWHRAQGTVGTDETVAADLERLAERAQARGGLAAAAAFLERAVGLTPDPLRRADRALAAAQANQQAGAAGGAAALLAIAQTRPLDDPILRACGTEWALGVEARARALRRTAGSAGGPPWRSRPGARARTRRPRGGGYIDQLLDALDGRFAGQLSDSPARTWLPLSAATIAAAGSAGSVFPPISSGRWVSTWARGDRSRSWHR